MDSAARLFIAALFALTAACSETEVAEDAAFADAAAAFADAVAANDASPEDAGVLDAAPDAMADAGVAAMDAVPAPDADPPALFFAGPPPLPEPLSNNAIATATIGGCTAYSVMGIGPSKTPDAISTKVYSWRPGDASWTHVTDVPGPGRLGASAFVWVDKLYVAGGHTVDPIGFELAIRRFDVFDLTTGTWLAPLEARFHDMVDAAVFYDYGVAFTVGGWLGRDWIGYQLPSGPTVEGDFEKGMARRFGHAATIVGGYFYLIDGADEQFGLLHEAWRAEIRHGLRPGFASLRNWENIGPHPGPARFRAAAAAVGNQIVFHGGTASLYGHDGVAYSTGAPAEPINSTLIYDTDTRTWHQIEGTPATMDHRGMVQCSDRAFVVGGMTEGARVSDAVWELRFPISL